GDGGTNLVDDDLLPGADLALESVCRDLLLCLHEAVPALVLHIVGDRYGNVVRGCASHRLISEAADTIKRCLLEPFEQKVKIAIGFAREANDESRTQSEVRAIAAPAFDALQCFFLGSRTLHAL